MTMEGTIKRDSVLERIVNLKRENVSFEELENIISFSEYKKLKDSFNQETNFVTTWTDK